MTSAIAEQLTERFFRYLAVTSQSDAAVNALPSTPGQHDMAKLLAAELRQLGLKDVQIDEHATVTARKPGNQPGCAAHRFYYPYRYRRRRPVGAYTSSAPAL
ncbi:Peptidase T [Serratia plymuthica]|uniref:Peptidase T n=1 Tax=Serratia plymuthica TaxID=82996 RepID=A0A2X4UVN6_SERPL|nr:Peptidase T [Serratia plymuthica]